MPDSPKPQTDKFKEAAREIGADEDEARWDERLRKVVKHRSAPGGQSMPDRPDSEEKGL